MLTKTTHFKEIIPFALICKKWNSTTQTIYKVINVANYN